MEVFRRKKSTGRQTELTAAAAFNLSRGEDFTRLRTLVMQAKARNVDPWKWYDSIPEVNYAIDRAADLAGHAAWGVRERLPDGSPGDEVDGDISGLTGELYSPYGGQRRLTSSFFALGKITGDCHLIRNADDGFDFVSSDELIVDEGGVGGKVFKRITYPGAGDSAFTEDLAASDYLGRVWQPHWRYVEMARSPLRVLDTICEELHLLTLGLKSKLLNRIALSGLLFVPSEMAEVIPANMAQQIANINLAEIHNDAVIATLILSMITAVRDHGDPSASLPIIVRGPGINGEQIRWITMDREIFQTDMDLREESVKRILTGLDIQPETVSGMSDSNHWNAWAIMDQDVKINVEPDLQTMAWALNRLWFWPRLMETGEAPEKYMLWYDLSKTSVPTNLGENARQAYDRVALSEEGLRQASGLDDRYTPDGQERIRLTGLKLQDPYLATFGLPEAENIDWTKVKTTAKTGPAPNSQGDPSPSGPGVGDPGSPNDGQGDTPAGQTPN